MKKHLEIKTYKCDGIDITVVIDYDRENISLIESGEIRTRNQVAQDWQTKKWIFSGRGLPFMNSWINILNSMKFAINEASKELKQYLDQQKKEKEDMMNELLKEESKVTNKK